MKPPKCPIHTSRSAAYAARRPSPGSYTTPGDIMLATLRAWNEYASLDLAPSSMRQYRYWIVRFAADTMTEPQEATGDDLISWMAQIKRGRAVVEARSALRHYYRWLHASGRRTDDPTSALPRSRKRRPLPGFLSLEEVERLIAAAKKHNEKWAPMILFLLGTGCRVSEMCNLRVSDCTDETVLFRDTKSGSDRLVHLGDWAKEGLSGLLPYASGGEVLPVTAAAVRSRFKVLAYNAGLPPERVHPHALRHTAATIMVQRGADHRAGADMLGHRSVEMFWKYAHIVGDSQKEVAGVLG